MSNTNSIKLNSDKKPSSPSKRWRPTLLDGVLLLAVVGLVVWLAYRSSIGINYHWRWSQAFELVFNPTANGGLPYFVQGIIATLRLSVWGMVLAVTLGTLLGLAKHSAMVVFSIPANLFIQLVRNIPPLVFIFIFYFFISNQLIPLLGLSDVLRGYSGEISGWKVFLFGPSSLWENLLSGVICIGLLSSAYVAEIIRAGLASIPKGQWEAGQSLGLSTWHQYRDVIAPQVLTAVAPALAGQAISLVKDTSIVSLISIQEMTFVGTEMANSSGLIFEIWLIVGLCYFLLCLTLSLLFRRFESQQR
ncbi:amino acid ABC transporter permease [Vibrio parahaemolyticus]|uniref:amino acid ABC transporter permease n=1 Tax=Vibrio mediterranei TaxID=689 RepID=UPI004067E106